MSKQSLGSSLYSFWDLKSESSESTVVGFRATPQEPTEGGTMATLNPGASRLTCLGWLLSEASLGLTPVLLPSPPGGVFKRQPVPLPLD